MIPEQRIRWWIVLPIVLLLVVFLVFFLTWNDRYVFTKEEIQAGENEIAQSRVIFAGLIRDREDRIPYLKKRLEAWGKPFKDYRVLVVENDSEDQTREKLLEWQQENSKVTILGCGENVPKCTLSLKATKDKTHIPTRISKMAYLRNIYVDHVQQNYKNWDYLIVNDFDLLAELSPSGWKSTFGNFQQDDTLGAVSAYGYRDLWFKKIFYDDFAFVSLNSPIETPLTGGVSNRIKETLLMEQQALETKKTLVPVKSAFSGLTVYRLSLLPKDATYDYCKVEDKEACEHSYFNQRIEKIVVHPGLKYRIIKNDA